MDISLIINILTIFFLILVNGFFSGSEIAIISLRKSRTKALVDSGSKRARLIQNLQKNPDIFFATVQIGVTLTGVFNGAFAGNHLASRFAPFFTEIPYIGSFAEEISMAVLVLGITYLTLVLGELVPKSVALQHSEQFSLLVAYPITFFSWIFQAGTKFLTFSSNVLLKPFNDKTSFSETKLSPEEILHLVEEGVKAGTIAKNEHELIENVLEMSMTTAREVMIPRVDIKALASSAEASEFEEAINSYVSRLPVYEENLDNIIGILHIKDLMRGMARNEQIFLPSLVRPVYYVPETMKIGKILPGMQKRKIHMAIVVDEYGGTAGLLTMEDILEEIVGEIDEVMEDPDDKKILLLPDGAHLVSGSCSIIDFNEYFESDLTFPVDLKPFLPESDSYTSVAGFVIKTVGRFPEVGEKIIVGNFVFELVRRVRQKLVQFRLTKKS